MSTKIIKSYKNNLDLPKLKTYPNPVLRVESAPLDRLTDCDKKILDLMVTTMHANQGVGLAAPQIGITKRMIVVDTGSGVLKMVNPEIVSKYGNSSMEEGCLSVPGKTVEVSRAEVISVSFFDDQYKKQQKEYSAITARAIQHEIDHLNGKLIIDYLPWFKCLFTRKRRPEFI